MDSNTEIKRGPHGITYIITSNNDNYHYDNNDRRHMMAPPSTPQEKAEHDACLAMMVGLHPDQYS